jgi:hypothetical protein
VAHKKKCSHQCGTKRDWAGWKCCPALAVAGAKRSSKKPVFQVISGYFRIISGEGGTNVECKMKNAEIGSGAI